MKDAVRVCDIDPRVLAGPYSVRLARAVSAPYRENGACYLGVHAAPRDVRAFFLTAIVDETSPSQRDGREKLMVQAGTQFGCSSRAFCEFCVYSHLPFYRNLRLEEIVDLFRLALFMHGKEQVFDGDRRILTLKFTDNGEPLNSPILPAALERLCELFGRPGKVLRIKISTILADTRVTCDTFRAVMEWQRRNIHRASVHLQISRSPYGKRLIVPDTVRAMIEQWVLVNPSDRVCIAPGLVRGYHMDEFDAFCAALVPVTHLCFFRPSVIKPTTSRQREILLSHANLEAVYSRLRQMGFTVEPLPHEDAYAAELEGAGTLAYMPDGKFYDPVTYRIERHVPNSRSREGSDS